MRQENRAVEGDPGKGPGRDMVIYLELLRLGWWGKAWTIFGFWGMSLKSDYVWFGDTLPLTSL